MSARVPGAGDLLPPGSFDWTTWEESEIADVREALCRNGFSMAAAHLLAVNEVRLLRLEHAARAPAVSTPEPEGGT